MKVHVLEQRGKQLRLVCHVPVPTANAGVNFAKPTALGWDVALVRAGLSTKSVLMAGADTDNGAIGPTETGQLASGALIEQVIMYDLRDDWELLTTNQKGARLQEMYDALNADVQAWWQRVTRFTGSVLA